MTEKPKEPRLIILARDRHIAGYNLPASMCREIGRVIVRCAYLEHYIQRIIYVLINIDLNIGRVAVREPRLTDRIDMLSELAYVLDVRIDNELLDSMKLRAEEYDVKRDLFAHCMWMYSTKHGQWAAQLTRGAWPKAPHDKAPRERRKKRLKPEGVLYDVPAIQAIVAGIDGLIEDARTIQDTLDRELRSSRDKQKSQFVQ